MSYWKLYVFTLAVCLSSTAGQVVPTTPGPNEVYHAGANCTVAWNLDSSGSWKNFTIDLMSGSNTEMKHVKTVASRLDGSDKKLSPYYWTCPEVTPYSNIYFYQFTNGSEKAWTTRFTITSPDNSTTPPEHANQPNGDAIPWGIGKLADLGDAHSLSKNETSEDEGDDEGDDEGTEEVQDDGNKGSDESGSDSSTEAPTSTSSGMKKVRTSTVAQPTLGLPGGDDPGEPQPTTPPASAIPVQEMADGALSSHVSQSLLVLSVFTLWVALL